MDEKDREIIRLLQNGFPLEAEPFKALGDKLWIDESGVISRLARMMQDEMIRYVGPFFDSRKLGYVGALAAMDVPAERVDEVSAILAEYHEITHNYLRDGSPNIWFTVIAQDESRKNIILNDIKKRGRIESIRLFPARRLFKIRMDQD
ncbi:MAG TPA: AsnC family transcriptional regulator [Candidatus Ozemobacteraceae bacterium]|mgnify:CR=1 FL=1|nr:AsnC family transcriptional regulator [Candidatus Ozemobacteraceae bacterium]